MALDPASMTPQQFMNIRPTKPSMFKETIDAFKSVGSSAKNVASSVASNPATGKVLATLRPVANLAKRASVPLAVGSIGGELIAQGMNLYGNMMYGGDGMTPAAREFAKTLKKDEKGNYIPPQQQAAAPAAAAAAAPFPQEAADKAADSFIDGVMGGTPALAQEAQPQAPAADPLAGLKETLAAIRSEREKIKNPLNTEVNVDQNGTVTGKDGNFLMQMRDSGGNPFAALAGLQQAVGLAIPQQVDNRMAKNNADALMKIADAESGVIKLEDTLKNSMQQREKGALEIDEGKLKLNQAKKVNDSINAYSALNNENDPDGTQRRALQDTILTLLGKETKDDYEFKEVGGGIDPATQMALPKRLAIVNKRTGAVQYADGGADPAQGKQQGQQYQQGQMYQLPDGKVVKFVGYDKDGQPQFDDEI